ncbi:trimeric intracellular cation channel family protein [Luteimonas sp. e5]
MDFLFLWLDLIGTFVFALSGAMLAVRHRLDLFGVLVLAFATASAGGIMRDVLIGATPPAALSNWRYAAIWLLAGGLGFAFSTRLEKFDQPVRILDAMGLAVFAVAGTGKALDAGIDPWMAPALGMLSGIGGGMLRDMLLNQVPLVLRSELYAVAALAGASVVALGHVLGWPPQATMVGGALLCFALRIAALRYGWHLPRALQGR